jgi:hypothetical protein
MESLYQKILLVHFWVAALAPKGGRVHRRAGKTYLAGLVGILCTTVPIIAVQARRGRVVTVVLLTYLFLVVVTAIWLTWRSIRQRRDFERFTKFGFRVLGAALLTSGCVVFALSFAAGSLSRTIFMAGLSSIGIVTGTNMWLLVRRGGSDRRWWLRQHLNGAAIAFAATHASFFSLGLRKLLPALSGAWMHTSTQLAIVALALVLRLWLGPRYLMRILPVRERPAERGSRATPTAASLRATM